MIGGILKSLGTARSATAEGLDALDLLREGLAAKAAEIAALHRAPLPVTDALKAFDRWADDAATRAIDSLSVERLIDPSSQSAGLRLPVAMSPGQAVPNAVPAAEALMGLIMLACRPQLRKIIEGQLQDLTQGRETLSDVDRARRIAVAEKELRSVMALEEIASRELEQAGVQISRRADADPSIILLTDAALSRLAG